MKENENNQILSDMIQKTVNEVAPESLGGIGFAMKSISETIPSSEPNRKDRRQVDLAMDKDLGKTLGLLIHPSPADLIKEGNSKPKPSETQIYRNSKELAVAGVEAEGSPLEKEIVKADKLVEITFEYFKRHPRGSFFWEYQRPNFNRVILSYRLCFEKIRPAKHGGEKNILVISKPESKKLYLAKWYEDYEEYFTTRSGYLFVSDSESVCGMPHVYSHEKYRKQFDYCDDVKGRIEFITLQEFENSIDTDGKIGAIRQEDSDVVWDVVIFDNIDIFNPALSRIKRRYTLYLLPHVSDFPEALPETTPVFAATASEGPKPMTDGLPQDETSKAVPLQQSAEEKMIGGYPESAVRCLAESAYGKELEELLPEEAELITSSLDNLSERIKVKRLEKEHERLKPSEKGSLKERLEWYKTELSLIERGIDEAEKDPAGQAFEVSQIRKEDAQKEIEKLEEAIKAQEELKARADRHDMDRRPSGTNVEDHLAYWEEDLYLAQNYYRDEERAELASENIDQLRKVLEIMKE